jgi:DHHC palmitoyltransferase
VWLTPIASVLSVSTFVFWLVTAATEPGIIPRNKDGVEPDMPLPDPETGIPWERCDICNVYRPPRAVHCRDCDNCVSRFDHHCAWIGNCVGLRNYKAFIALLWSGTLLGALVFAMSCYRVAVRIMGAGAAEYVPFFVVLPWLPCKSLCCRNHRSPEYGAFTIIDGFWDGLLSWAFFVVSLVVSGTFLASFWLKWM